MIRQVLFIMTLFCVANVTSAQTFSATNMLKPFACEGSACVDDFAKEFSFLPKSKAKTDTGQVSMFTAKEALKAADNVSEEAPELTITFKGNLVNSISYGTISYSDYARMYAEFQAARFYYAGKGVKDGVDFSYYTSDAYPNITATLSITNRVVKGVNCKYYVYSIYKKIN